MARQVNKWRLIHTYFIISRKDLAPILRCPDDDMPYYSILSKTSPDPVLHCAYCNSNVTLGLDAWQQILAAVNEHYPDVELER